MRTSVEIIPFPKRELFFTFGFAQTSFGLAFVGFVNQAVCVLEFVQEEVAPEMWNRILNREERCTVFRDDSFSYSFLASLFDSEKHLDCVRIALEGTFFQLNVWKALLQVSFGTTLSYKGLADLMQKPKAVRAVASAVARNPVSVLIPCHRILRSDGNIGEYRWGSERKTALILWEKEVCNNSVTLF